MLAQGTSQSDGDYFTALTARINAIDVCSELQEVVDEAMASIQAEKNAIEAQITALLPILNLLTLPTDLPSVLTWISNLVNHLIGPIVVPYETYLAQVTTLISEVSALATAIENAANRIKSCSITIPPLT
jgi:phage-related protein